MKQFYLSFLILAIILSFSSFLIIQETMKKMAIIIGSEDDYVTEQTISDKLSWINPDSNNIIGRYTPLIMFTSDNNEQVKISVAEGELQNNTISPEENWQSLLNNGKSLIVNSPDENYSCPSGGINGNICEACKIEQANTDRRPGLVEIKNCSGVYNSLFNINYVANAVVVNFRNRYDKQFLQDEDLSTLRNENLKNAVNNIFDEVNRFFVNKELPKYFIIPSIGTGIGQLRKHEFYDIFFKKLSEKIKNDNSKLPDELILMVWREDIKDRNDQSIASSIVDGVFDLYRERIKPDNKKDLSVYYSLLGISISMLILLLLVFFSKIKIFQSKKEKFFNKGALITIGIIVIAFGLTQSLSTLPFDFIKPTNYTLNLIWGLISIPISLIITSAIKLSDNLTD